MRWLDSGPCGGSSLFRPNRDGAVGTAILGRTFEGKAHMLTGMKHPVAGCFDMGEVDETAARHLRRIDYAPAFVRVELLDHSRYSDRLIGGLPLHGLIVLYSQTALSCCTPATAGVGHFPMTRPATTPALSTRDTTQTARPRCLPPHPECPDNGGGLISR